MKVRGSSPLITTNAEVVQLVERQICNLNVVGSRPIFGSNICCNGGMVDTQHLGCCATKGVSVRVRITVLKGTMVEWLGAALQTLFTLVQAQLVPPNIKIKTKNMYYIVQENCFRERNYDNLIQTINKLGLEHEIVKVKPFIDEVEYKTNRKDVFVFGSLKLSRVSKNIGWNPGSTVTDNLDYRIYSEYYKDNLLNYDSIVQKFGDDFNFIETEYFIRPCEDNKAFNGKVYDYYDWNDFKVYSLNNGHDSILTVDTPIQISTVKKIYNEARFWVVDGKIITHSTYKIGSRVVYDNLVDSGAVEFCHDMIALYQPNRTFVMDIALTNIGYKIIELGATSHAGFYDADIYKLLTSIEEAFK